MNSVNENCMNFNRNIKINFDGGNLSSDSGLFLYKKFDEKIGFSKTIAEIVKVNDSGNHAVHKNEDVILQRIYQNIAGYHTDDVADTLRLDPVFNQILNKESLASQPTISRLNNKLDIENVKQFQKVNSILFERIYNVEKISSVIFDVDSTNSPTYGEQHGSAYNAHYGENGFHPLLVFNGLNGDCIKAELRSGSVYTSRRVVNFIGPVLKEYNQKYPGVFQYLRGDSGFAVPKLYELCEMQLTTYVIRLKANSKLYKLSKQFEEEFLNNCKNNIYDEAVIYKEFMYKAKEWNKARRVVVKIEKPEGRFDFNYTFIVTNSNWPAFAVVQFYCKRGSMENYIKEGKNGFAFGKMSSTDYWSNANKLQEMVLAYNLNNWMRRICFPEKNKSDRIETIRTKIIKIASKVVSSGRYIYFKLSSSCPYKKLFTDIFKNIKNLQEFVFN